jgi:hypothetical protein
MTDPSARQQTYTEMRDAMDLLAGQRVQLLSAPFLQHLLATAPPGLRGDADEWGWDDTEVRGQLADHVSRTLLGRPWPRYGQGIDLEPFIHDLMTAHDHWRPRPPQAG